MKTENSDVNRSDKGPYNSDEKEKLPAELPAVQDDTPSAEVVSFDTGMRLSFFHFVSLLQLIRWQWEGDKLLMKFRLMKRSVIPLRKKMVFVRTILERIHSVYFSHFCRNLSAVHRCPFIIRKFLGFRFEDDNSFVAYWRVAQWCGEKDEKGRHIPITCFGSWDPGENDDEFKCNFIFAFDNGVPPEKRKL